MRTTLNIDDAVFDRVKQHARAKGVSLSKAASSLLQKAIDSPCRTYVDEQTGVTVFDPGPDAPRLSWQQVKQIIDEDY